ncbi:MAG TPA: hypothetical protein VGS17_10880 [Candidatus Limnocylindria bacterium]|nr:hypothetical protein [Candidatus Limnocylindria bacterium]
MRVVRSALLAIIAAVVLSGGMTLPADAKSHPHNDASAVVARPSANASSTDPGDPGLPPD